MFDPYHTWLGIPPKDQPPNHYRVLGLEQFEPNPDVISNAADRQMSHVRNVGGNYEQERTAVLSRLSTARVCLLDDAKRQQYDRLLRKASRVEQAKTYDRPPMPGPTKLDRGATLTDSRPPMPGPTRLDRGTKAAAKPADPRPPKPGPTELDYLPPKSVAVDFMAVLVVLVLGYGLIRQLVDWLSP